MEIADLSPDRIHQMAVYLADAEAARRTRHHVTVKEEDRWFRLEIGGHLARVFTRHTAQERPMRRGTQQDTEGARARVFVDLSSDLPAFYVTPPDVKVGEVEQYPDHWDLFDN
ncbi:hypothetical protein [Lentzea cavernae]|uniref:Uncharacterized protein n=1 Tax=Lentzea cavernae TaxID=2020703 RepID=A0ABQ3MH33_9PSEU|nr:hypothetical protein [Lentzea cavernae]GHH42112.1 hypothetical protein GCM10017774_37830 [Lentzea cavernae]